MLTSKFNHVVSLVLLYGVVKPVTSWEFKELPHLMNEHELSYYFGSNHREELPLFEVFSPRGEPLYQDASDLNRTAAAGGLVLRVPFQSDVVRLRLRTRTNLVTKRTRVVTRNGDEEGSTQEEFVHRRANDCHYLHVDHESSAAVTSCDFRNYVSVGLD